MSASFGCPSHSELLDAAAAGKLPAAIAAHVKKCTACRRYYVAAHTLHSAYAEGVETLTEDIGSFVESVLDKLPPRRWQTVAADDRTLQHDRVITYLLHRADATAATASRRSVDYAATAAAIAEKMHARHLVPAERLLAAMRDHATHLRTARMYGAALFVLTAAESVANTATDAQHERAILNLCRAILFMDSNVCRLEEAGTIAAECELAFAGIDARRGALATFTRASVAMRLGDIDGALSLFFAARAAFASAGFETDAAFADQGIANCLVELGRLSDARAAIDSARAVFRREAMTVEIIRVEWIAAKMLARAGEYDRAIAQLGEVAADFLDVRMIDEWVRVRLQLIETTLAQDPGADVRDMCESTAAASISLDEADTTRTRRCTAEALEYLRQAARRESVAAPLASYVGKYVEAASTGRFVLFAPPSSFLM